MLRKDGEYKLNSYEEKTTRNNDLMAKVQLTDITTNERYNCIIWQDCLVNIDKRALRVGNVIAITEYDFNEKFKNVIIKQIKLVTEASIGLSETERDDLFNNIIELVNGFKDEKLRAAILEQISQYEALFKIQPAARIHHHNYVGGLLQHITECIDFSKALFPVIPVNINHELVLAACVIHDFGKIFEYKIDTETGVVEMDEEWLGVWINHIQYGFSWASERGFHNLAHLIASHHGIKDYGALVEPATREAELLHKVDWLSSRVGRLSVEELESV